MITLAADTASAQGWRRPLLAWLQVQALRANGPARPTRHSGCGAASSWCRAASSHARYALVQRRCRGRPHDAAAGRCLAPAATGRHRGRADRAGIAADATVDGSALAAIDSAAALVLLRALQRTAGAVEGLSWAGFSEVHSRILGQVRTHLATATPPPAPRPRGLLAQIGQQASHWPHCCMGT